MRMPTFFRAVLVLAVAGYANVALSQATCSLTCPANITVSNDPNQCGAVVNYPAPTTGANDQCGTVTCSPASGSFFPKGTTTETCTATAGPTCTFTITVNDTQPPAITAPQNILQVLGEDQTSKAVNYPPFTATDNCPGVTVVGSPASGSVFSVGQTNVTGVATDSSGNTATTSFFIQLTRFLKVPTMSDLALIVLAILLAGLAARSRYRRHG